MNISESHSATSRVLKRRFMVLEAHRQDSKKIKATLLIACGLPGQHIEKPIEVTVTAAQLMNYRKLQTETLEQTGNLIYDQKLEADGVSKWPRYLADQLGEVPREW